MRTRGKSKFAIEYDKIWNYDDESAMTGWFKTKDFFEVPGNADCFELEFFCSKEDDDDRKHFVFYVDNMGGKEFRVCYRCNGMDSIIIRLVQEKTGVELWRKEIDTHESIVEEAPVRQAIYKKIDIENKDDFDQHIGHNRTRRSVPAPVSREDEEEDDDDDVPQDRNTLARDIVKFSETTFFETLKWFNHRKILDQGSYTVRHLKKMRKDMKKIKKLSDAYRADNEGMYMFPGLKTTGSFQTLVRSAREMIEEEVSDYEEDSE